MEWKIKDKEIAPIELIMCPYCGSRLNRVQCLIPTSCCECNHHGISPKIIKVMEVIQLSGD